MEKSVHMGMNKTGAQMAPQLTKEMVEGAEEMTPPNRWNDIDYNGFRRAYAAESEGVGSVPLPGTFKGAATMGLQKLTGRQPEILIDKMAERLAFERTGVRLYDAFLLKAEQSGLDLPMAKLQEIRDEELSHFLMLKEVIEELGADPTAQTPCADVTAVISMGAIQALHDPRTDIPQALNTLLTIELTDVAGWELLIELASKAGLDDVVKRFAEANAKEEEHLVVIKDLLRKQLV